MLSPVKTDSRKKVIPPKHLHSTYRVKERNRAYVWGIINNEMTEISEYYNFVDRAILGQIRFFFLMYFMTYNSTNLFFFFNVDFLCAFVKENKKLCEGGWKRKGEVLWKHLNFLETLPVSERQYGLSRPETLIFPYFNPVEWYMNCKWLWQDSYGWRNFL